MEDEANNKTTIAITKATHSRLNNICKKSETHDEKLNEMMDLYENTQAQKR